jgi:glucose dehydrogenase
LIFTAKSQHSYRFKVVATNSNLLVVKTWAHETINSWNVIPVAPDELLIYTGLPNKTQLWDNYFMDNLPVRKRRAKRSWKTLTKPNQSRRTRNRRPL